VSSLTGCGSVYAKRRVNGSGNEVDIFLLVDLVENLSCFGSEFLSKKLDFLR